MSAWAAGHLGWRLELTETRKDQTRKERHVQTLAAALRRRDAGAAVAETCLGAEMNAG